MSSKIIACSNLKEEINFILNKMNKKLDIIWMDSKLHNNPKNLNKEIELKIKEIDENDNVENILLLYGACGNSIENLVSRKSNLIYLRADDCFNLLLGGIKEREKDHKSYFFTKSYIENELSLWNEFHLCEKKYGKEKTKKMYKSVFKEYENIKVIDTGSYDLNEVLYKTYELAQAFDLEHKIVKGNLRILEKALEGNWDDDFVIVKKNENINIMHDLYLYIN